jgi:hypothetical protein
VSAPSPATVQAERFQGGQKMLVVGGGLGLLLVILSVAGLFIGDEASQKLASAFYLVAFTYWCGIAFASVLLLQIFHATRAKWMIVLKRPVEAMGATMPLFLLLFVPVILSLKKLYTWVEPEVSYPPGTPQREETLKALAHKAAYLNSSGFVARGFIFIALASIVVSALYGWSKKQDASGDPQLTQKQRNLGAGAIPFVGLAMTFAAFDWLMSLNPTWFSTVFGVYWFGGSFVSALSLLAIVTDMNRSKDGVGVYVNAEHTHNIGKLMLAFICFWTYIAFSQLLLIWIAGLPEETPFYITRFGMGWVPVGVLLIVGHFFLPFGALLSRSLKRSSRLLGLVGMWILLIHFVDIYWLVIPRFSPDGVAFHWTLLTAPAGVGLMAIAFGISRLRGQYAVPVKDPYLADSLRYRQP